MDIAALGYEIDSTQARTAARDLDRLNAASVKVERNAMSLSSASRDMLRGADGRFMSAAQSAAKYGDEIEAMRMKYNPLYAASKQFEAQQSELNRALALGAISVTQYEAALSTLQAGMVTSGGAANVLGREMTTANMHTANVFAQLNDIGVMMASGQNPLILAIQQGTQLNQVWGLMGSSIGGVAATLKDAFLAMLSPMSLLTIGVIAGGAALVQWGISAFGASENAQTFTDAIDAAQESIDELNSVTSIYSQEGLETLREKYGLVNSEISALIENQRILAQQKAIDDVQAAIAAITAGLGEGLLTTQVGEIAAAFETTSDRARGLLDVMQGIGDLPSLDRQLAVIESLKAELSVATNGFSDMTAEQVKMLRALVNAEDQMRQLENAIRKSEAAAQDLSDAAPGPGWMSSAITETNMLIGRLIVAKNAADAVRAVETQGLAAQYAQYGQGRVAGETAIRESGALFGGTGNVLEGTGYYPSDGGGGGGGGGGGSDPYADNLNRLVESLRTEREVVDDWYNENLTILQDRRAMEILGEQAHKEAMLDLEKEYQERKSKLAQGYDQFTLSSAEKLFGELHSLSGSSYEGLLRVQKTFGAAQALVNTYTAASQVLADPKLGFFAKFAAVSKTVAAGLGLVNAIKGGGNGSSSAPRNVSATAATRAEPDRVTRVELVGDDFLVNMAESIMEQIYSATSNGRVIVSRAYA